MVIGKMLLSPDIERRLGPGGVAEVAASLWPVDCQTCGRPLGQQPPSLCVDDMTVFAYASLHHERCRAPAWNDGPLIGPGTSRPLLSHRTRLLMLPLLDADGGREPMPSMVVNPAMESVFLAPEAGGRWRPQHHNTFTAAGLVRPGPGLRLHKPVRGARARLAAAAAAVIMTVAPFETYECDLAPQDEPFRREINGQGGIMLTVSHAVDPAAGGLALQLNQAMSQGRVLCGWAALDGPGTS